VGQAMLAQHSVHYLVSTHAVLVLRQLDLLLVWACFPVWIHWPKTLVAARGGRLTSMKVSMITAELY
jgi:hypothetical protein